MVEESLYNLGVDKVSLNDVLKMDWQLLDDKIRKSISAAKISSRTLFAREKQLCAHAFEGFDDKTRDYCFVKITKEPTDRLLTFAEAVATTSRTPKIMFRVLDLYEALIDLIPDIEDIYSQDSCRSVHEKANKI
ncbi:hypothetical protein SUGI_0030120 [Cryptomeria japonica]|nr:hypothetical protein SUGI_0030120 [Cryptomeria japonica]